jgi:hypothetical protein
MVMGLAGQSAVWAWAAPLKAAVAARAAIRGRNAFIQMTPGFVFLM